MKKPPKKIQAVIGLIFFIVVVAGVIIGSILVKRQQDIRNQASGGAAPNSKENALSLCIVIEANGTVLNDWFQVPPSRFSMKAGPLISSFSEDNDRLPDKFEDGLDTVTIEAPRDTNATLENGMNAVCQEIPKRSPRYIYKRLEISTSGEFEGPKYNDVFSKDENKFHDYSGEVFDSNIENHKKRNANADGVVNISGREDRKIIVYLKLKSPLIAPTAAATATPTVTPTSAAKATSAVTATPTSVQSSSRTTSLADNVATATPTTQVFGAAPPLATSTPSPTATQTVGGAPPAPTNTPTRTPTRTPTNSPTRTPTRTPTPLPQEEQQIDTSSLLADAGGVAPTAVPTSVTLSSATKTATPTSSGSTTSSSTTTSATAATTKTPTPTTKPRTDSNLDPSDAPVSGGISDTLFLVFGGGGLLGGGLYLLKRYGIIYSRTEKR